MHKTAQEPVKDELVLDKIRKVGEILENNIKSL